MTDRFDLRRAHTSEQLAQAVAIRREVFTDEQGIPEDVDDDGRDLGSLHLLVSLGSTPVATGRVCVEGSEATLARIAVRSDYRGQGIGRRIVRRLEALARQAGAVRFVLHPHASLESFYRELGYRKTATAGMVGKHRLIEMRKYRRSNTPRLGDC
ncbi:MAG TPA: GNAT family N-acetyltransferase [Acidobacteriota bacterium]|nr:GNAT family N-acetyltransferase [Acidobacteriota bacterium]